MPKLDPRAGAKTMKDFEYIETVPCEERCAQVGSVHYYRLAHVEIAAMRNMVRRIFGQELPGMYFRTMPNEHDFGTYYTLNLFYDNADELQELYAQSIEDSIPMEWQTEDIVFINSHDPEYFDLLTINNAPKQTNPVSRIIAAVTHKHNSKRHQPKINRHA
jgi:hypothetical protein